MDSKSKDSLWIFILLIVAAMVLLFVVPLVLYLNSDERNVDANANVVKEVATPTNNNDNGTNSDETQNLEVIEPPQIQNNVEVSETENVQDIENLIVEEEKEGKDVDPFYPAILEQIKKQESIKVRVVNSSYYPGESYIRNAVDNNGKLNIFKNMPIKVFIPKGEYYDAISQAIVAYNAQFKGVISFVSVSDPTLADIKITIGDDFSQYRDGSNFVGLGGPKKIDKNGYITLSNVYLLSYYNGEKRSLIGMYNTALHEIGHALGIQGHSDKAEDVMYYGGHIDTSLRTFTKRDIETLTLMYSGRTNTIKYQTKNAVNDKLRENLNYMKTHTDDTDSYIEVADSYMEKKNYDKALTYYKKAMDINPDNPRIYLGLSDYYDAKKNNKQTIKYANLALQKATNSDEKNNAYLNLYNASIRKNDYDNALQYMMLSFENNNSSTNDFISYLKLCKNQNKKKSAKEFYNRYSQNVNLDNLKSSDKELIKWAMSKSKSSKK